MPGEGSGTFHLTLVSCLGSPAPGSSKLMPNVSFHDAEPAVCRPGVGSVVYVTPISEVKRGSWYAGAKQEGACYI